MHDEQRGANAGANPPDRRASRVFMRVMIVQLITLMLLWLLQSTFGTG